MEFIGMFGFELIFQYKHGIKIFGNASKGSSVHFYR